MVYWPFVFGCASVCGIVGGSVWLQKDGAASRILERPTKQRGSARRAPVEPASPTVTGMIFACLATWLPIDELKIKLMQAGAVSFWAWVLTDESNQAFTAVASLAGLLDWHPAFHIFLLDFTAYDAVAGALLSLLEAGSSKGPQGLAGSSPVLPPELKSPGSLLMTMALGATLVAHPGFCGTRRDGRLWEAFIVDGGDHLDLDPELPVYWSAIVCSAAQRPDLATSMLLDARTKRRLLKLAEATQEDSFAEGTDPESASLQRGYALAALHRMAMVAKMEDAKGVPILPGRTIDEFLEIQEPALPMRPPMPGQSDWARWKLVASSSVGGLLWGALRGLPRAARAVQPVWRTSLLAGAGAAIFSACYEGIGAIGDLIFIPDGASTGAGSGGKERAPNYDTIQTATMAWTGEFALRFGLLAFLVQPGRAPHAFGGWLTGVVLLSLVD